MNRNRAHVNSASCMFFSPAAPSEPTPKPEPALGMYSLLHNFVFFFLVFYVYHKCQEMSSCKNVHSKGTVVVVMFLFIFIVLVGLVVHECNRFLMVDFDIYEPKKNRCGARKFKIVRNIC